MYRLWCRCPCRRVCVELRRRLLWRFQGHDSSDVLSRNKRCKRLLRLPTEKRPSLRHGLLLHRNQRRLYALHFAYPCSHATILAPRQCWTAQCASRRTYSVPLAELSIVIGLFVCVSVRANISLELLDRSSPIFCACPLGPWLGPPLAALRYIMYF